MPGRATAPATGEQLEAAVAALAGRLGLQVHRQVRVGRRIWGAERRIDLILGDAHGRRLGVECKYQGSSGSAEEKIPATIDDLAAWPIAGLVVFAGAGFSAHMTSYLLATGKAIELGDLDTWLRLFFGLPLPGADPLFA